MGPIIDSVPFTLTGITMTFSIPFQFLAPVWCSDCPAIVMPLMIGPLEPNVSANTM
jgi:hypothetical protein